MQFRSWFAALALVGAIGGTLVASEARAENKREEVYKAMDTNGDTRLDGKEMKTLKKQHPRMYDNLMNFCDEAKERPKKAGVDLPADPTKKQKQCKKKHVARPYLKAWVAQVQEDVVDKPHIDRQPKEGHAR